MTGHSCRFIVRVAVTGIAASDLGQAASDFAEELALRDYWRVNLVSPEPEMGRLVIEIEETGAKGDRISKQIREELLEVGTAVVRDFDELHSEILEVRVSG